MSFVLPNPDEFGFVFVPKGEGPFDMLFPNGLDWVVPNGELAGGAAVDELKPEFANPVEGGGCVPNGD